MCEDLARHEIFRAKVGKGGIKIAFELGKTLPEHNIYAPVWHCLGILSYSDLTWPTFIKACIFYSYILGDLLTRRLVLCTK